MKFTEEQKALVLLAVGQKIKFYREARGWTQVDLEIATGIPSTTISSYENGLVDFQISNLILIATALNITLAHLYPWTVSYM
ncbi:helix-turn-helix transcriptional regulator [Chitinophaga sp. HK235]|uniref:helix-turn-helix domain-containing protein n=1 Tax=Chitinophaga sp. HK235 TaxID=2952571 RepID=UPI001BA64DEA